MFLVIKNNKITTPIKDIIYDNEDNPEENHEEKNGISNFNSTRKTYEKECFVQKNEKSHIKICGASGKILLYKLVAQLKNLKWENIIFIIS